MMIWKGKRQRAAHASGVDATQKVYIIIQFNQILQFASRKYIQPIESTENSIWCYGKIMIIYVQNVLLSVLIGWEWIYNFDPPKVIGLNPKTTFDNLVNV